MTRPDPESLILDDLTPEERRALLGALDRDVAAATQRLGDVLSSLEAEDWRAAETPKLRFVPEGAGQPVPLWSRVCVRGDAGEHRISAPAVALGLAAVVLLSIVSGFVLRGATDDPGPGAVAGGRLDRGPVVSLVRSGGAPKDAAGIVRTAGSGGVTRVSLRAHGLPAMGRGRWYELWMVRDDRHMVSVGTFRVREDGTVAARFRVGADPERFPRMDVSVQTKADGSAHSGRSVLRSSPAT